MGLFNFCKTILGVGVTRRATYNAKMGELGRFPLKILFLTHVVKYLVRIIEQNPNSLLFQAFQGNISLKNMNKPCWLSSMYKIFKILKIENMWNINCSNTNQYLSSFIICFKSTIKKAYEEYWYNMINNINNSNCDNNFGKKLRTNCKFKSSFELEPYLKYIAIKKASLNQI